MEAFLQKKSDTMCNSAINERVAANQFGKKFPDSMEFDFTKFSGKRRRSETEPKLSCNYCCSETETSSPKTSIWDVYTKHNNFAKRKMQIRTKSGLSYESVDEKKLSQIISVKPMNKEEDTTDKDDSTTLLIKPKEVASDDERNKVKLKSNGAELTTKEESIAYDFYDEEQPDVVATTVTPKRLYFSDCDESSNELSPSEEKQQSSTKSTREKKSSDDNNNKCEAGLSVDEDDSSAQPFKKLKLDEEFRINRTKHVPTQPKNKKKKETKQDRRRRRG